MAYRVTVLPAADKVIASLPISARERIAVRLAELAENPRVAGTIKMRGETSHRARVGDYRIIYVIRDNELLVTAATFTAGADQMCVSISARSSSYTR